MANHPNRARPGRYEIRLADTGAPFDGGMFATRSPFSAAQVVMAADFASRLEAIAWYDEIRSLTHRQQVTLYGPGGSRQREAWGTAETPATFQKVR